MFEIQTYDKNEWINRWTVQDERGKPRPCRFKTYTEALKYLCDFLETKHGDGWYSSESQYKPHDYRIMEIDL